jgi:hypothetical protein
MGRRATVLGGPILSAGPEAKQRKLFLFLFFQKQLIVLI